MRGRRQESADIQRSVWKNSQWKKVLSSVKKDVFSRKVRGIRHCVCECVCERESRGDNRGAR